MAGQRSKHSICYHGSFINYKFNKKYDLIVAFAYIHLFDSKKTNNIHKLNEILNDIGLILIGTTKQIKTIKKYKAIKQDYVNNITRFRVKFSHKDFVNELGLNNNKIKKELEIRDY